MKNTDKTWLEVRARLTDYVRTRVNEEAVDDLVHDILLSILQNQAKFLEAENPVAWMYTVAKNKIIDHYRKKGRQLEQADTDGISAEVVDCHDMPDCVDINFASWLEPLTLQLEETYRDALLEVDFKQTAQVSLARELGIPLSTLKSRVQRARLQLKSKLLACCSFEVDRFGKPIDYKRKQGKRKDSCC